MTRVGVRRRVRCPLCGRMVAVTDLGKIWKHSDTRMLPLSEPCRASDKTLAEVT